MDSYSDFYIDEQEIEPNKLSKIHLNCAQGQTNIDPKFLKIENCNGHPIFRFELNGKIYSYGFTGIEEYYRIILDCVQNHCVKLRCGNHSAIYPLGCLR
jgi:hypothetical protein